MGGFDGSDDGVVETEAGLSINQIESPVFADLSASVTFRVMSCFLVDGLEIRPLKQFLSPWILQHVI